MSLSLTLALHRAVARQPHAVATVCGARRRSFGDIAERVARFAGALRHLGVRPGERVGLLSLNSDRYVEALMAVPWAGGAVNPVNTRWSAAEIAYSLDDCDTQVLLIDDPFVAKLPELRERSKALRTVVHVGDGPAPDGLASYEALVAAHAPVDDAMRRGDDLAGVFYTGGTTGFPKGVMLSHTNLAVNGLAYAAEGAAHERSVGLHAAPMFHIADNLLLNGLWTVGARQICLPAFDPVAVMRAIETERVTTTLLVPTMIQMLVDHPALPQHDLSSLELLFYGASPISEAVLDRAQRALPGAALMQGYGMTEVAPLATILPPALHTAEGRTRGKLRSAGRPAFCAQVRIVDEHDTEVPRGTVGEIAVRGPGVMLGYWNRPDETAQALRDGWMHTGDAGRMDDDGYVFVVDRLKDMVITGGENVYSVEVENALAQHPAVTACAVIGVPDDAWGERVHAVVVLKPGAQATLDDLREHCRTRIAAFECPRSAEFVAALPLSGAGKVLKTALRAPHWVGRERNVG
jgi:long-chain acyl-CoA synthetase